jgi:hypothetical protein
VKRFVKVVFNKFTLVVLSICLLFPLLLWVGLRYSISANRRLWELAKPSAYYMQVTEEGPKGTWRWEVYVQSSRVTSATLLEEDNSMGCGADYNQRCESITGLDDLTIETMFEKAKLCQDFYFEDCRIDFDNRFGYPKHFGHLLTYVITIDQFRPCEQVTNCPPK